MRRVVDSPGQQQPGYSSPRALGQGSQGYSRPESEKRLLPGFSQAFAVAGAAARRSSEQRFEPAEMGRLS